jgi:hypothetical protein
LGTSGCSLPEVDWTSSGDTLPEVCSIAFLSSCVKDWERWREVRAGSGWVSSSSLFSRFFGSIAIPDATLRC